jgi:hypothetical protein
LADLDARQEQLKRGHEACIRWDSDHAPQLRRAQLAGLELLARHDARLIPADAWRNSVAAIERFRAACGIDHAGVALGWEVGGGPQEPHDLIASQVDLTLTPPAQHPGIERVDQLAVDL